MFQQPRERRKNLHLLFGNQAWICIYLHFYSLPSHLEPSCFPSETLKVLSCSFSSSFSNFSCSGLWWCYFHSFFFVVVVPQRKKRRKMFEQIFCTPSNKQKMFGNKTKLDYTRISISNEKQHFVEEASARNHGLWFNSCVSVRAVDGEKLLN